MSRLKHEMKIIACLVAGWLAAAVVITFHLYPMTTLHLARALGNLVDQAVFGFPPGLHTTFWIYLYHAVIWTFWAALAYGLACLILFGGLRPKRLVALYLASLAVAAIGGWFVMNGQLDSFPFKSLSQILYFAAGILIVRDWPAGQAGRSQSFLAP